MNKFQKRYHKKQSQAAAVGYIPAADCIGKTFVFGQFIYYVAKHHPRKKTFALEIVNAFNQRIEKDETFVRHHCTPVSGVNPAVIVQNEDIEHQPVDDKMTLTAELKPTTVGAQWIASKEEPQAEVCPAAPPLDPAYYLDQIFSFVSGGTTFTVTVQAYNERRKQFRLYDIRPEARSGSFYRDAAFVYQHCQPAETPVIREPLPQPTFDPFRFWNLVSLVDKRQILARRVQETGVPTADPLLLCECCGKPVMILGIQIYPPKYNRKNQIVVECQNEDCVANDWTATTESHHEACEKARAEAVRKGKAS